MRGQVWMIAGAMLALAGCGKAEPPAPPESAAPEKSVLADGPAAAISEVSRSRGLIGNFQRNVVESNIRSLGTAKENLSATESSIRDTDVAEEMTYYTKLQILQQSGLSVLAQANQAPQAVLSLLRG